MVRFGVFLSLCALFPAPSWSGQAVGLSPIGAYRLENPPLQGDAGPQESDTFAATLARGDFNGDGYADLAVGVPRDDGPISVPISDSGSVMYYPGGPTGPATIPARVLRQPAGSGLESGDRHGSALAACDFNHDGFDDLAVGAMGEDIGTIDGAGAVFVYPGTAGGPENSGFLLLTQDTADIPDQAEANDAFGAALACGDFDADGFDDLAIGSPGERIGTVDLAGWIVAIPGSATGLVAAAAMAFSQADPLIFSGPEIGDQFGSSLAVGDLDGDGFDDLAIGSRGEDDFAGCTHVLFGSPADLIASGSMVLSDERLGGLSEAGDQLGMSLAIGDFDADGFDDLVLGIPHETFNSITGVVPRTGQVVVVYGHAALPALGRIEYWAENNIFLPGTSEAEDHFGEALAVGDFDGDGYADLAVGHPGEEIVAPYDGAVTVMSGSAAGLNENRGRLFLPAAEGVPGPPPGQSFDRSFGAALAAGDLDRDGHGDLVIGAPFEFIDGLESAGSATLLFGALFADGFESGERDYWSPQS
jgi:hypothetical protein